VSFRRRLRALTAQLCWIVLALVAACGGHSASPARRALAPTATVAPEKHRIVSLIPSLTDDLFAIGAGPQVVAVSAFTSDIPAARNLPRVADFMSVDVERIAALRPDLVVGIPPQARLVRPLRRLGIEVALMPDDTFGDLFNDITRLGELSGHVAQARALVRRLQAQTRALHERTRTFRRHPRVFVVLDVAPIWTAGPRSYLSTLIALAGGRNAVTSLPGAYGEYSAEALLRLQPDVILTDPATHFASVVREEPWRSLRAVREGHVIVVDPPEMLERPGPEYVRGLRWLIERLQPLAQ